MFQDYHVIFIYQGPKESVVYDLDTALAFPCLFQTYSLQAIGSDGEMKPEFHRQVIMIGALLCDHSKSRNVSVGT